MSRSDNRQSRSRAAGPDHLADEIPEDPRIVEVAQDYLAQLELGLKPDRKEFQNRYPDLSDAIGQCLDGLDMLHVGVSPSAATRNHSPNTAYAGGDAPPTALGDFQIIKEVARGGMGIVYEAVQLSLGRRVALKVLPFAATLDARQLQRFKNEAQAAALLHHTNIVPVYAVGCERGVHFYAMQLIEGESLATLIEQMRRRAGWQRVQRFPTSSHIHSSYVLNGDPATTSVPATEPAPAGVDAPLPETLSPFHANLSTQHAGRDARFFQTAARLMLQAARALEHAHEFGIVHRDIKPGNLLLDVLGSLWITDFGLAQFHTDAGLTRTGDIPGTMRYMSPEQASGQAALLDGRTDLYSLGATFYELLTLDPIFDGRNTQTLLNQILRTEPRGLRERDKTIPAELETIVLKCISKSAADRYRSAGELAADIVRYLEHKPIHARRPTLVDRARKWSRRHPSVVAAGMLLMAIVTVGLFISNRLISAEQENTKIEQKKTEQRANEATENFRQAKQAVDMLIQVSEDELADNPMMQPARQRLLEIALDFYQGFIEREPKDAALAAVKVRVEGILRSLDLLQQEQEIGRLRIPEVQADLELTDSQKMRLQTLLWNQGPERNPPGPDDRTLDENARRQHFLSIAEAHDQILAQVLSTGQRQRLKQISIQFQGMLAFKDPKIVQALKLTAAQKSAIREVEHETFGRGGPFGRGRGPGGFGDGPGGGPRGGRGPRDDFGPPHDGRDGRRGGPQDGGHRMKRTESVERVLKILSEEQVAKWKDLTGRPLANIDDLPFGPPQGFGPGNFGQGNFGRGNSGPGGFGPPPGENERRGGRPPDGPFPPDARRNESP